ncbi:hypothetical protein MOV61_07965 [Neorhizobium sp. BETTINA12A]|jgi:hypothetical protein|uniref:hypothetical protein n=1 Tax=unclassified Neorhizobium TaxID=2629175 RepID=UPI001FF58727|nr:MULTISPECIES: hypothetical protein [unclassified Neorhizobium]MCJ9670165.1 hypothetical protein [Neorhizobium sp. SHOUNA12B]MCJ9744534.1 hypothetical protein [Neorhizobium sp. SHOUNA12A]MCJ9750656.1 hypothetical protein [Neorhizobium sp. BETTINA12A]
MNRILSAGAVLALACFLTAGPGFAEDKPLIWKPIRNSDTSYSVKLGLKLPTRLETEAGISMGVDTTTSGTPVDTPIKFWSNFTAQKIQTPAYQLNRGIGVDLDGNTGSAGITMNYYEKEIATPTIDIERRSSYGMRYDGASGEWRGVDASQSVSLLHSPSRTALVGRASGSNGFRTVGAGVAVEKTLGRYMTLSGALDRTSDAPDPVASVNARYSFRW